MLKKSSFILLTLTLVAASSVVATSPEVGRSGDPDVERELSSSEVGRLITVEQIEAYQKRTSPSEIVLTTGETLKDFLAEPPTYELTWIIISGGGVSHGERSSLDTLGMESSLVDTFELESAIGQPVAGVAIGGQAGEMYELRSGLFETGEIFSDGFESGDMSAWSSNTLSVP